MFEYIQEPDDEIKKHEIAPKMDLIWKRVEGIINKQEIHFTAKDILSALHWRWFQEISQNGSHKKLRRVAPDWKPKTVIVPVHTWDIKKGTLHGIARQAWLTTKELLWT